MLSKPKNLNELQLQAAAGRSDFLESQIGNTPLLRLRNLARDLPAGVEVLAKAEYLNPGGSVKDRPALLRNIFIRISTIMTVIGGHTTRGPEGKSWNRPRAASRIL